VEDWRAEGVRDRSQPLVGGPVRAGSAPHREPLVRGGHERSRPVCKNPRSQASTPTTPERGAARRRVRAPHPRSCRGPLVLANEASGRRGRASPSGSACDHRRHAGARLGPRRPCPPRARTTGIWRPLTVNSGPSLVGPTCAIGVGSGRDDGTARAFQARDRGPHPTAGSRTSAGTGSRPTKLGSPTGPGSSRGPDELPLSPFER
jgi:hypothetical protein